jgi:fused signal recognition particle receptor
MRRWFRRREKHREKQVEEQESLTQPEGEAGTDGEPEGSLPAEVGAAASGQRTAEDEGGAMAAQPQPFADITTIGEDTEPGPEGAAAEATRETAAEAESVSGRGFFHRWLQGGRSPEERQTEEEAPAPGSEETELEAAEVLASPTAAEAAEDAEAEGPEAEEEEAFLEVPEARRSLLRRFHQRLTRTREALAGGLDRLLAGRKVVDAALLEELEELLISADIGVETTLHLIRGLEDKLKRRELGEVDRLKAALGAAMMELLKAEAPREKAAQPWVVLLVGVNGVGKTTTIAKLAHLDLVQGRQPLLIAGDTFRAAAAEQLEVWGERVGAPVIRQKSGADPAAVVFDGLSAALARGVDTVYIDTAGRIQTKVNLMEELKKIYRTAGKKLPGAPHEVLLILDATTGQNALSQARLFHEAVGVTGLVLTTLDGTAKGGVALAEDLRPFDAEAFVAAILG